MFNLYDELTYVKENCSASHFYRNEVVHIVVHLKSLEKSDCILIYIKEWYVKIKISICKRKYAIIFLLQLFILATIKLN